MEQLLVINEIYTSIQGESSFAGRPCTFVRLTGCPLRCKWCDTAYAFAGGKTMTPGQIMAEVRSAGLPLVELTGGEPLAQAETAGLAGQLLEAGYEVLIETGGSEDVSVLDDRVHIIMDVKCPGSGMEDRNREENFRHLKPTDELKFVLADEADFHWAAAMIRRLELDQRFQVLMSPAFGLMQPRDLVALMLDSGLRVRLNLQLHKYIWHPRKKGV